MTSFVFLSAYHASTAVYFSLSLSLSLALSLSLSLSARPPFVFLMTAAGSLQKIRHYSACPPPTPPPPHSPTFFSFLLLFFLLLFVSFLSKYIGTACHTTVQWCIFMIWKSLLHPLKELYIYSPFIAHFQQQQQNSSSVSYFWSAV